jgi:two-component system KDP operon response regulator KdpE
MKILIADTDNETIEETHLSLNQYQPEWQVPVFDSGKQCLDKVRNGNCPDVVILGMQLSDMSGLDLIKKIRDDSDIPIIVLSREKDVQILVKAFDVGANDYMVRPFNKQIFLARLKALIRRRMWNIQTNGQDD